MGIKRSAAVISLGLLLGSVAATAAQEDGSATDIGSFRTREIEPGVLRVLDDNAGHDLTKKWPQMRRDIDHIAVGPDGQVWLSITASGPDNERLDGARLWPLGQEVTYGPKNGLGKHHGRLLFDADGNLWVLGNKVSLFDGEEWTSTQARRDLVAPDGTVWLASGVGVDAWDGSEITHHLDNVWTDTIFVSPDGTIGVNAWNGIYLYDGGEWGLSEHAGQRRGVTPDGTLGVLQGNRNGFRLYRDGEVATVLKGTNLNEMSAAPDGSFWLAGGVGRSNGGVYRVDPVEVFASLESAEAETAAPTEAPEPAATDDGSSGDDAATG